MPTGGSAAMGYAKQIEEIGFPEFTTKLVGDTFDALIAANIRQQQAYIELLQATSKSLTQYVNDTKDDITPAEIVQLFSAIMPPKNPTADGPPTEIVADNDAKLTADEADRLNDALAVEGVPVPVVKAEPIKGQYDDLVAAAATRIAANKYTLLQEMVRLGMLRLIVTDGTIETRLNFRAYGSDYFSKYTTDATTTAFSVRAQAQTGGLLSNWVKASASTAYSRVRVQTTNTSERSSSSVDVQMMGGVKINFRTDYLPVAEA